MKLFIEGHNHLRGYAVSREYSPEEILGLPPIRSPEAPVRHYGNLRYARRVVDRFNRLTAFRAALGPSKH